MSPRMQPRNDKFFTLCSNSTWRLAMKLTLTLSRLKIGSAEFRRTVAPPFLDPAPDAFVFTVPKDAPLRRTGLADLGGGQLSRNQAWGLRSPRNFGTFRLPLVAVGANPKGVSIRAGGADQTRP